jgi:hypothetical protein
MAKDAGPPTHEHKRHYSSRVFLEDMKNQTTYNLDLSKLYISSNKLVYALNFGYDLREWPSQKITNQSTSLRKVF